MAEQLRAFGAPAEVIARVEAAPENNEVGVLGCNWLAVAVYRACQWTLTIGPSKAFWQGVAMTELHAALQVLRVPRSQWEDTAWRVQTIVATARLLRNG